MTGRSEHPDVEKLQVLSLPDPAGWPQLYRDSVQKLPFPLGHLLLGVYIQGLRDPTAFIACLTWFFEAAYRFLLALVLRPLIVKGPLDGEVWRFLGHLLSLPGGEDRSLSLGAWKNFFFECFSRVLNDEQARKELPHFLHDYSRHPNQLGRLRDLYSAFVHYRNRLDHGVRDGNVPAFQEQEAKLYERALVQFLLDFEALSECGLVLFEQRDGRALSAAEVNSIGMIVPRPELALPPSTVYAQGRSPVSSEAFLVRWSLNRDRALDAWSMHPFLTFSERSDGRLDARLFRQYVPSPEPVVYFDPAVADQTGGSGTEKLTETDPQLLELLHQLVENVLKRRAKSGPRPDATGPGSPESRILEERERQRRAKDGDDGGVEYDLPMVWEEQRSYLKTFVGRSDWLARLQKWAADPQTEDILHLLAPPGQGKSALLSKFADLQNAGSGPMGGACLLHMLRFEKNPRRVLQFLAWQAARAAGHRLGSDAYEGDVGRLRNLLWRELQSLVKKRERALVIIDELDQLDRPDDLTSVLPENLPPGAKLLLSSQPKEPVVRAVTFKFPRLRRLELPPLAASEFTDFLTKHAGEERANQLAGLVNLKKLFQHVAGNPALLRYAVARIVEQASTAEESRVTVERIDVQGFPRIIDAMFDEIYQTIAGKTAGRAQTKDGKIRARMIQLLAVAREPLSVENLRDLLRVGKTRVSLETARDLVGTATQYLLNDGKGRVNIWNPGLGDFIGRNVLAPDGLADVHRTYSDWLDETAQLQSAYRVEHLPSHLLEWGLQAEASGQGKQVKEAFGRLGRVLTDFEFVDAKVRAGMVFELLEDYRLASQTLAFKTQGVDEWLRFLDRNSSVLIANPKLFLQQALNDEVEGAVSTAAEKKIAAAPNRSLVLRLLDRPEGGGASSLLRTLRGHEGLVLSVGVTPDGRYVVSGGGDGMIKIWELESGREIATLLGHESQVNAVAVDRDGEHVVSGSADKTARVWRLLKDEDGRVTAGELKCTFRGHDPDSGYVNAVAVSPVGNLVASAGADKTIRLWKLENCEQVRIFKGHDPQQGYVNALVFTPDGRWVVSGSADRTLRLWSLTTEDKAVFTGHDPESGFINAVAVTPDGRFALSASADATVKLWDLAKRCEEATLSGHRGSVNAVVVSKDGRYAFSGGADRTLRMWDLSTRDPIALLDSTGEVRSIALTPEGRHAVTAVHGHVLRVWTLTSEKWQTAASAEGTAIVALAVSADGRLAASGSDDGTVSVWGMPERERLTKFEAHEKGVKAAAFAADGALLITASFSAAKVWDWKRGMCLNVLQHGDWVLSVAASSAGELMATVGLDGAVKIWDMRSGGCRTLRGHDGALAAVAFGSRGRHLLSAGDDQKVRIWDVESGECIGELVGHNKEVNTIAVTKDSQFAVTGGGDRSIRIWNLPERKEVAVLTGHGDSVRSVSLSPDGTLLVSGSYDESVIVWRVPDGQELARMFVDGLTGCCIFARGDLILAGESTGRTLGVRLEGPLQSRIWSAG